MPWAARHGSRVARIASAAAKEFEVISIPRPGLVDATGTIVAADQECRGAKLDEPLKKFLRI
jgi:hypothetical protein